MTIQCQQWWRRNCVSKGDSGALGQGRSSIAIGPMFPISASLCGDYIFVRHTRPHRETILDDQIDGQHRRGQLLDSKMGIVQASSPTPNSKPPGTESKIHIQ